MHLTQAIKRALPLWIRTLIRPVVYRLEKRLQSRRLRALYQTIVRPGDLVFDLGAHLGEHTEHFLALGAKVVALEPQPACLPALRGLLARHPKLFVLAQAVGATEGMAELCIPEVPAHATLSPEYQQARFPNEDFTRRVHVQRTTLDALIAAHGLPDYIKIDTEGHELPILSALSHRPKFISFEFSRENLNDAAECVDHLDPAVFNLSLYSNQRLIFKEWIPAKELIYFLLAHPDSAVRGDIFARLH